MSVAVAAERIVTLSGDGDLEGFRREARALLRQRITPESIVWRAGGEGDLFAKTDGGVSAPEGPAVPLPRAAVKLAETALHHSGPDRFALLYRFLFRSLSNRSLPANMADPDTVAVHKLEKAVRRDAHKMHAFVRFRKVDEVDGRERYAAWFEPDHHIVQREAAFFMRRFSNMDWVIVTPRQTAIYEAGKVRFAPGGSRDDVPADDAFEDAWRAYYANIFNPARIMTDAMRAEMPKKYWKNLPEATLINELLEQAPARVAKMNASAAAAPKDLVEQSRAISSIGLPTDLAELNAAIRKLTEDMPSPAAPVFGEGPVGAALMLIGEQPGDDEDRLGRPFVGPAGQLLNQLLTEAQIDRTAAYVTNAVKQFHFVQRGKRRIHQTPKPATIDAYAPYLVAEHQAVGPQVTVTLGASALRAILGKPLPLSRVRGEAIPLDGPGGGTLVPTFHPSYLLRIKDDGQRRVETRKLLNDLEKAKALIA
ncbi:MAG: UdgX family uracil-DNA binding protein [Pseudomonadota bacterium]